MTIQPRGAAMGVAFVQPDAEVHLHARHYLEGQIRKVLGGRAAEELVFGSAAVTSGASSDLQQATRIAKQMVYKLGNVLQMFHERRSALESLADALLKHETLTGDAASASQRVTRRSANRPGFQGTSAVRESGPSTARAVR